MRLRSLLRRRSIVVSVTCALAACGQMAAVFAANATWSGTIDSLWSTTTNWSVSPVPGPGDTATFNGAGNGNTTVNLGGGVTLRAVLFDTASAAAYTIGSGPVGSQTLTLEDTGSITMNAGVAADQTFNANILLGTATTGTYALTNDSTTNALVLNGLIQGGTGGTGAAKTLTISGSGATTINGLVGNGGSSALALTKDGSGTLTFAGTSLATGNTTVSAGTLNLTGVLGGVTAISVASGATLSQTASGLIGVNNAATLTVTGTATLSGSNQYTGATTVNNGGILNIRNGLALGTTATGTTVNTGGELQLQGGIYTLAEALSLNGTGTATTGSLRNVSGFNTYLGAITLASATRINSDAGRLTLSHTVATSGHTLTIGGAGAVTAAGVIGGAGGLVKEGTGTLALFAANTYTGNTTLAGGTVLLGSAETAGTSGPLGRQTAVAAGSILFSGGTLQYSPQNNADYSGRFSTTGGQAISIDTNSRDVTYATALSGAGTSLTKSGFGTLTLSAAPGYDGGTTVSGGTLLLSGALNMPGTGGITVGSGGTFSLADGTARTTTSVASLALSGGATLAFDWNAAVQDTLTSTAAVTASGPIAVLLNNTSPTGSGGTLLSSSNGGLGGATYYLANNTNYTATLSATDTAVSIGVQASASALTSAYWVGNQITTLGVSGIDNAMALSDGVYSNWSSAAAFTPTGLVPGSAANLFFSATSGPTPSQQSNIVLGSSMNVNSLTFNDVTPVTIAADGSSLRLNATGTGASSAISTNETSTINAGIILGANQTWTTAAGRTLTVGGTIGNVTGGAGLTIAGAGTARLTGTAAYSGATTVNNGATLEFAAGSRKTYLGSGSTFAVSGVANVAGDLDVQTLGNFNGVINVTNGGVLTVRSATGGQDVNVNIGGGGYGALTVASGGSVTVLGDGAGGAGSMNIQNGGNQGLLRITGGTLNVGAIMTARNGGGTSEITITDGLLFKPGGVFNLGDRGSFATVLNVAGGLIDNTGQTLTLGRSGGTAGSSSVVTNFNAGTILTRDFGTPQANFQVTTNYNGGTVKLSPGVAANFYGTPPATSTFTAFVNGSGAFAGNPAGQQFGGGVVFDTNGSSTNLNVNLLAPTGNGITSLSLATGGSGYTGPPTITITDAGITRSGTTSISTSSTTIAMTDTSSVFVGQSVSGTGIPAGSIVTAVTPNTSITISQAATAAGTPTLTFRGVGATAYATVGGGAVTGVVITNPGVGYVGTVTATLGGGFGTGGSGTAATFGAITPAANTSGGLTKNGVGTLTLSGATTFTGATAVNQGTLAFGSTGTATYASSIAGPGTVSQTGTGMTILTGTNTYTGPTVISAGVLRPESAAAIPGGIGATGGTSPLTFNGGVLDLSFGNFERPLGAAGVADAVNFTGAGGWAAYGADRAVNLGGSLALVTWATANTGFNGQTLILGNATATHTVDLQNPLDLGTAVRTVQLGNGAATADGLLSGTLTGTGAGGITKTGAGTLVLGSTANAYAGATTVNAGTLLSSTSNVIPDASAVTVSGNAANVRAVLDVNGRSESIGALSLGGSTATSAATVATGSGTLTLGGDVTYSNTNNPLAATILGNLALGSATRTFTVNDSTTAATDLAIPAAISGASVGLTKAGAGTLLLTGANTYTGVTTVSAGTLTVGTRSALANDTPANWTPANIAVNSGATLALGVGSGAAGYFGAADIDTLLDAGHLGGSTTTTGLKTGSVIGFDTTNATGGAFSYSTAIADTTGATPTAVNVSKLGPGTLTLGGNNTYTGTTTVSQGTLVLTGSNTGSGTVTVAGGVLRADQGVGLNSGSLLTLSGGAVETGANLERTGGTAASNMQITGGTSGFSAAGSPVQVAFGTLASPTALTWGTAPFAPATLLLNASTATSTLDLKNAVSLVNTARTIQVDANVATMSGVVSNTGTSGTLTKTGNGTLVLSANNSYNAATVVTAGTLLLTGTNASTGTLTAQSGGTLKVNGATGSIAAAAALTLGNANFAGGGAFVYDNVGAVGSTSQTIASLTTSVSQPDDNTVQVIRTAAQPVSLIITTLSNNASENGNVVNFVTTDTAGGGVNGTDYKIVLANQTTLKISVQNAYFNGSDFAVYQGSGASGYVRGVLYGTDANTATSAGGTSFANPGTLTSQEITGSITAQPATTLASGTLNGSLKIVGTSNLTMQQNAALTIQGASNSGAGGILKTGGGTSTISGGAGTTGTVSLTNTQGNIRVDGPTDVLDIAMPVTWAATTRLTKSGAGTLIFSSGTLPFTDTRNSMWVNGGTFEIGGNAFHNGSAASILRLASGALFRYSSSSVASFRSGTIQGAGSVQITSGALALTNTGNSYTGTTTLDGGTLNVAALANGGVASSIGQSANAAANLVFGGGTLQYTGSTAAVTDRLFTIGTATGNAATLDASGTSPAAFMNLSNTGAMAFGTTSPRTLTLTGSNAGANALAAAIGDNTGATSIVKSGAGFWTLSGTNTYSGSTTISAGTLEVAVGSAIGDTSAVSIANVAGARLLVSSNETIGSLAGGGASGGEVALGFNALTVGDATSTTFAGTITGAGGGLAKRGTGVLVLSGTNTYSGPTTVAAGTLSVGPAGTINGTSGVLVTGATFSYDNAATALTSPLAFSGTGGTIAGTGLIGVDLAITAGNTLSPGNSPGILSQNGNQVWGFDGNYNWQMYDATGVAGVGFDRMAISGTLTITPFFNFNLWSLSAVGPDTNGAALNFNPAADGYWVVATAAGGLVNPGNLDDASLFTAANNGTGGFANSVPGTFRLEQGGSTFGTLNDVVLVYAVPEPAGLAGLGASLLLLLAAGRRRWCR